MLSEQRFPDFPGNSDATGCTGPADRRILIEKVYTCGEKQWHIPAVSVSDDELSLDVCIRVEPEQIRAFLNKWMPVLQENTAPGEALLRRMDGENPMKVDVRPEAVVNGTVLRDYSSSSDIWIPTSCRPEGVEVDEDAVQKLKCFGLDGNYGWILRSIRFPWTAGSSAAIRSLTLKMEQEPAEIRGQEVTDPQPGQVIPFIHPMSGVKHTLTVVDVKAQTHEFFGDLLPPMEIPTHHTRLTYRLEPDIPNRRFSLRDTESNDALRVDTNGMRGEAASIGIIGGEDGPTAIFISDRTDEKSDLHTAHSALHYRPADSITWYMEFREKLLEDGYFELF